MKDRIREFVREKTLKDENILRNYIIIYRSGSSMKHVEKPILIPIGHETARTSVKTTPIDIKKDKKE